MVRLAIVLFYSIIISMMLLVVWHGVGNAQLSSCGKRETFVRYLGEKYKETPKFIAITGNINLIEVFTSVAGTWTVLITSPDKITCIIASGDSWEAMPPVILGEKL